MNNTTNTVNTVNTVNTEKRGEISTFLENLIDQYKSRLLTEEQERRVTEFYMKECFLSKDSDTSDASCASDASDNLSNDSLKYLVMGWYVYEQLIKKNNL